MYLLFSVQIGDQSHVSSAGVCCCISQRGSGVITGEQMETCAWHSPGTLRPPRLLKTMPQFLFFSFFLLKFCGNHGWSETAWAAKTTSGECVSLAAWPSYLPGPRSVTGILMAEFLQGHWLLGRSWRDLPHWWGQEASSFNDERYPVTYCWMYNISCFATI